MVSGFRIPDSGFRFPIPDSGFRFRIPVPHSGFRFPGFRVALNFQDPSKQNISKVTCISYRWRITWCWDHNNILLRLVVFEPRASQFGQFSVLARLQFMRSPAMIVLNSKKIILTYLQKLKSLDLLMTQDSSLRKVWGKLFFDTKFSGPLLERLPLNFPKTASWKNRFEILRIV